jgi:8-oxo-dGTP pyrophosphatase MutT (NUDIX family)/GH24 family phage-related lysozyme (muramidase)
MPFEPNQDDFLDADQGTREYWGSEAAGCIFIARDTGRILLAHRSNQVDYEPETWGTWGGKVDAGETPKDAVEREVEEETGFTGRYKIHPLYVYRDGEFSYHNYLVIVPFEFAPQLNWENEGSVWVEYGQWPEPLHFGMEELIKNDGHKIKRVIDLIKSKKAKNTLSEMDTPPAIHHSTNSFSQDFVNYIKSVENSGKSGFKKGKWYPHKSPEGGMPTIGYGHKIKSKSELKKFIKGVDDRTIEKLLVLDLQLAKKKAHDDIKKMFGVQIVLDDTQEEILTDYAFNLGTLTGFPKFVRAVLNKNWEEAGKEYKRTVKVNGNRVELGRNKVFANRYLKSLKESYEVQPQGLIDISTHGYKWVTPYGYLAFGHDKTSNVFHLLMIQTKPEFRDKGYSKELLRKFFEFMKEKKGRLNPGSYTMSGMAWVKHVLERFSKEFNVPIINVRHPQDV